MSEADHSNDLGRQADVLTKVADQLSEKLVLERKANAELRALTGAPDRDGGPGHRHRHLELAAVTAMLVGAATLVIGRAMVGEPPASGDLWISSTPAGARVRVDGRTIAGLTPMRVAEVDARRSVEVLVWLDGYAPWSTPVRVERGGTTSVVAPLQREAWTLAVASSPAGATVMVDGVARGRTPTVVEGPPNQALELDLELAGYVTNRRRILLARPETQLAVTLTAEPAPSPTDTTRRALTADDVRAVVVRERSTVQACYEAAARRGLGGEVRLTVLAQVAEDGSVRSVQVRGGVPSMRPCITKAVRRWRFPATQTASQPEIPFLFTMSR